MEHNCRVQYVNVSRDEGVMYSAESRGGIRRNPALCHLYSLFVIRSICSYGQ